MGKGSRRRPSSLTEAEQQKAWDEAFGPRPLANVMSEKDRRELAVDREMEELVSELVSELVDEDEPPFDKVLCSLPGTCRPNTPPRPPA